MSTVATAATSAVATRICRPEEITPADAFCATRLDGDWGHAYGTLPGSADLGGILRRALPAD